VVTLSLRLLSSFEAEHLVVVAEVIGVFKEIDGQDAFGLLLRDLLLVVPQGFEDAAAGIIFGRMSLRFL